MKKIFVLLVVLVMVLVGFVALAPSVAAKKEGAKIQDGTILDSKGNVITTGYDQWGYNYQAHLFNGYYHNNPRPNVPYTKDTIDQAPSKTWLVMKWSDSWLSNMDRNYDGKLDRGNELPYTSSAASGAWCTNHQWGSYIGDDDNEHKWNYFVKIVYPGDDAYKEDGMWYTSEDVEIGTVIWGAYAIIQQVYNDPYAGDHGIENKYEAPTGFGYYK